MFLAFNNLVNAMLKDIKKRLYFLFFVLDKFWQKLSKYLRSKVFKLKTSFIFREIKIGEIIKTKAIEDKVIHQIELNEYEAQQLKNHATKVHLFSANLCNHNSRIVERGNKGGAKYFIIPLSLKSRKKKRYSNVSYQKIETKDKIFFVCVVDKDPLF